MPSGTCRWRDTPCVTKGALCLLDCPPPPDSPDPPRVLSGLEPRTGVESVRVPPPGRPLDALIARTVIHPRPEENPVDQRAATVTLSVTVREQDAPVVTAALADALASFLGAAPQILSLSLSAYPVEDDEETVTAAGE